MKFVFKKMNKKGFSLIELIVVIAILAIIAAVAIPRFAGIQDKSEIKADATTASEIVNAARIQESDTGTAVVAGNPATTVSSEYMIVPATAQSGTAFAITGGGANPYVVTWTVSGGNYNNYTVTVTENDDFDFDTDVVAP